MKKAQVKAGHCRVKTYGEQPFNKNVYNAIAIHYVKGTTGAISWKIVFSFLFRIR